MTTLSRRMLLGALGAGVASSLLPRFAYAANPSPKRLIVFFSPNGTIYDQWKATQTGSTLTFNPMLSALTPYQDRITMVDNIVAKSASNGPGDDHMKGMGHMLTGIELLAGTTQGGAGTPAGLAGGISIDQLVAKELGKGTRINSLELGAYVGSADVWSRMIYSGANQPLPPIEDPLKAFQTLFSGTNLSPDALARLIKKRQSVLDGAASSLDAMGKSLGGDDKVRLDQHAASVREIEKQLLTQSQACVPPTVTAIDKSKPDNYKPTIRIMIDMMVAALACDQTRVASIQCSRSVSNVSYPALGITEGHHDLSHFDDTDLTARDKLIKINTFYAEQFAYLLQKLDAVKEPDGSLLDNSLVLWMNELSKGNAHSHSPMPVILAGKAQGKLKGGRIISLAAPTNHNRLLVSVANLMDQPITTFGNPAYCAGGAITEI